MRFAAWRNASGCGCWRARRAASRRRTPASSCSGRLGPALGDIAAGAGPDSRTRGSAPPDACAWSCRPWPPGWSWRRSSALFAQTYPDVVLDVTTTEGKAPRPGRGAFDAGIHLGEFVERDMMAVRVSADQRAAIVAAPGYLAPHRKPQVAARPDPSPMPELSPSRGRDLSVGVRAGPAGAGGSRRGPIDGRRRAGADSCGRSLASGRPSS